MSGPGCEQFVESHLLIHYPPENMSQAAIYQTFNALHFIPGCIARIP